MDVLIVDDERDLCLVLSRICLKKQLTVACAYNLEDGLKQMRCFPLLMFLDKNLPDGSGLFMIRTSKALSPRTKIVFITSETDVETRQQALLMGADYFLAKPFSLQNIYRIFAQCKCASLTTW